MDETREAVSFPRLATELGLSRRIRDEVLTGRLVTPIGGMQRGRPTRIPAQDAERVRQAVKIAVATGIAVVTVLRLLASGTVVPAPNLP